MTALIAAILLAAVPDTVMLCPVDVTANAGKHQTSPTQTLDAADMERLGAQSAADALRFASGVQVKDYGGLGGLKTVDVRSMGAQHVAVTLDGIALGNAQNGQIDLGQYALQTLSAVKVVNGQESSLLQPALVAGYGSAVGMTTARPDLSQKPWRLNAHLAVGSARMLNPSLSAAMRLSPGVTASLSARMLTSDGRYRFRYHTAHYDTMAVRQGGDITSGAVEANVFGTNWRAKAYYFGSDRGLPGAIVNNVWHRDERLSDHNMFVQGAFDHSRGPWSHVSRFKAAHYRTLYDNRDQPSLGHDNLYCQTEVYASTAHRLQLSKGWEASAALDMAWHRLLADTPQFVRPDRLTVAAAATARYIHRKFTGRATMQYQSVADWRQGVAGTVANGAWSPSLAVSLGPWRGVTLRGFAKRSFRMPTFNDLYYTNIGSASLRPERATQFDLGVAYILAGRLELSLDGYHNIVADKIVAIPRGQQFRWSMLNLGRVRITGADLTALYTRPFGRQWHLTLRANYSLRHAVDVTQRGSGVYGHQIPYTPLHTLTCAAALRWRGLTLDYTLTHLSERYSLRQNLPANRLAPYTLQDLALTYARDIWSLQLRVDNVAAEAYEVIAGYPMPLRTFRLTATYNI